MFSRGMEKGCIGNKWVKEGLFTVFQTTCLLSTIFRIKKGTNAYLLPGISASAYLSRLHRSHIEVIIINSNDNKLSRKVKLKQKNKVTINIIVKLHFSYSQNFNPTGKMVKHKKTIFVHYTGQLTVTKNIYQKRNQL